MVKGKIHEYRYKDEVHNTTEVITLAPYECGWLVKSKRWPASISVPTSVWDKMQQSPMTGLHYDSEDLFIGWELAGDIIVLVRNGFLSGHIPVTTWNEMLNDGFWKL